MINHLTIDVHWVLICALLVALMQPGFTALEAGATRAKNSISTAVKNISDFIISFTIFALFGASLMFGQTQLGWVGWSPILFYDDTLENLTLVIFHAMFASTTVTIISGSIAERTKFSAYLFIALFVSMLIYPVQAHWIWHTDGWLAKLGFIDFAGATTVHSVGGWVALAAIIIIGPRLGRFENNQKEDQFDKANLAYSTLGVLLIWLGWIGFNAGNVHVLNYDTAMIVLNTFLAGAIGGLSGIIYSRFTLGYFQVQRIMNGVLAGLVAVTAGAALASPLDAIWIGIVGYASYQIGHNLLIKWQIDDALDAVPVHLFAGIAGTLTVVFLVEPNTRFEQLKLQFIGITAIAIWAFGLSYLLLKAVNRYWPLRVTPEHEMLGLNIAEHRASNSMYDLISAMNSQATNKNFTSRLHVEPFSDADVIANFYNNVTHSFNELSKEKEALIQQATHMATHDNLTGIANRMILLQEVEHAVLRLERNDMRHALLFLDLDGFKAINDQYGHDAGDIVLIEVSKKIHQSIRKTDLAARIGGDEFAIFLNDIKDDSHAIKVIEKILQAVQEPIMLPCKLEGQINASIGLKTFNQSTKASASQLLKEADAGMYEAKRRGKGQWVLA